MTDRELRKLSRKELLELLLAQVKENEALKAQLDNAAAELNSREIAIDKAGSIAEASLLLNGVFEAAQAAGAQYLENIQRLSGDQDRVCAQKQARADAILQDAENRARTMLGEAKRKSDEMVAIARQDAQTYWEDTQKRLKQYCESRSELRELLEQRRMKEGK